jgi:hypothetical protein
MKAIISRQTWSKLIIEETTSQWYASVDPAFKKVCPLKSIKVKEQSDWWNEDCEDARKRYQSMYTQELNGSVTSCDKARRGGKIH